MYSRVSPKEEEGQKLRNFWHLPVPYVYDSLLV